MKLLNRLSKQLSPTRLIALSFLIVILIGACLLSLDISNKGTPVPFIDHLFIATSATCVTGLVSVTVANQYTIFGQIVIILLIQIGGLGFLTLLNMFIALIYKRLSLNNKLIMQEALNCDSLQDITKYIKNVIRYTFTIELIGAICLSMIFIPEYGPIGIYYSLFHSISAFCNAGFDVLGSQSLIPYATHLGINIIISLLIILGSLGFVVMIELQSSLKTYRQRYKTFIFKRYIQSLSLHTKIVFITTIFLIAGGMLGILMLEYNNPQTLGQYNLSDKLLVSYFQSVTLRTAGFASVDMSALLTPTKLLMCIIMFIGGSPASTAGGIKTVTFTMMILYIVSIVKGEQHVRIFNRDIDDNIIKRSLTIIIVSFTICLTALFILTVTEQAELIDLLFEIFSAFATVGLSANLSSSLTAIGKYIIIILMYIGRIGPITLVLLFTKKYQSKKGKDIQYAKENVLIG